MAEARIDVVVDIFSGRPNPSFTIPEADSERIQQMLHDATGQASVDLGTPPDELGFRGFLLADAEGNDLAVVTEQGVWIPDGTAHPDLDNQLYTSLRELAVRDTAELDTALPTVES